MTHYRTAPSSTVSVTGAMTHYRTAPSSTVSVTAALGQLADVASVAGWDPGVLGARLASGAPGQVAARYGLVVLFGPPRIPLEHAVIAGEDPRDEHPGRGQAEAGLPAQLACLGAATDLRP